ncbi:MAG: endonuclease III domain-containing protein [Candidatus Omnitrophica bacterium]|nr:endonuclease III domain-containing protein [Candidatus Omnitrophota bacterium]
MRLIRIYNTLNAHFGDLKWWPADTPFEVIVGAVLVQNTSWRSVEISIRNLKERGLIDPLKIYKADKKSLADLIRPSGFNKIKSLRLKAAVAFIMTETGGVLSKFNKFSLPVLRKKLLTVHGIGPETADCILLYALNRPVFVVDNYTRRIFSRHGLISEDAGYETIQRLVHDNFPKSVKKLNQFHALLVETGKRYCGKTKKDCVNCPLLGFGGC